MNDSVCKDIENPLDIGCFAGTLWGDDWGRGGKTGLAGENLENTVVQMETGFGVFYVSLLENLRFRFGKCRAPVRKT